MLNFHESVHEKRIKSRVHPCRVRDNDKEQKLPNEAWWNPTEKSKQRFFFLGSSTRLKFLLVDTVQLTHQTAPKKTTRKIKAKTTRKVSDCRFFGCTSFRTVSTCKTTAGRQNLGIELDPTLPFLFSSFRTCWSGSNPSIASWIQGLSMLQKKILRKPILSTKVKKNTYCGHHLLLNLTPSSVAT